MMELGLTGRRAVVTGGATGIGKAIAEGLAREGVTVAITSRKQALLDAATSALTAISPGHVGVLCDIVEEGAPARMAEEVRGRLGPVDIVVNNVGDTLGVTDPYCPIFDWRRVFRLNLEVHVEVNNAFLPHMRKQKWGRIVNITAGAALENSGPVTYCSAKAAYTAYTRCMGRILALEGANVVMSAVLPGVVLTEDGHWAHVLQTNPVHAEKYLQERTVLRRFGRPDEISPMVVLLASNLASFCIGSIVPVEGGQARHYFAQGDG
jgi:3-oxoacyl-[acyl-carrier protein] reductase